MKALIIEDEMPAQISLQRAIEHCFDDVEVVGTIDSVKAAVKWLQNTENIVDIIFMDVELSDGMCFDIFKQVEITAKVIITTAYNSYAIKAFKVNSIDYLLKPVDEEELTEAVNRCRKLIGRQTVDVSLIENSLNRAVTKEYKQRFAIKIGNKIVVVNTGEIAYFLSEDKSTFAVTADGKHYMLDTSLDALSLDLNPNDFFRISRAYITSIKAITNVAKQANGKLKITLTPTPQSNEDIFVSRFRMTDFIKWLDGK